MSLASASYLARRAAQKERVRILYRRALKDTLNWAVHRHLFYPDVSFHFLGFYFCPLLPSFAHLFFLFRSQSRLLFFFFFLLFCVFVQADALREKFDANRHVVCLIDFILLLSFCVLLVTNYSIFIRNYLFVQLLNLRLKIVKCLYSRGGDRGNCELGFYLREMQMLLLL